VSLQAFDAGAPRALYTVTSWTERDGMPSSYVRAITQDSSGYLWLATYSGLVRFDGVRFTSWTSTDGSSLPSEDLSALLVARDGSLWVGGFGGVSRISDGRLDKAASTVEGFFKGSVAALLQDDRGHIWASGQSGIAEFDGTRWRRLGTEDGLPERPGLRMGKDANGAVWIGTSIGLHRRAANKATFETISGLSFAIEDVTEDGSGRIIVPHPTGLFTSAGGPMPQPDDPVLRRAHGTRLLRDRDGYLWIGTRGHGLVRFRDGKDGKAVFDRLTSEDGLSADSVLALFQDRQGNIWVGTPYGVNRLSRNFVIPVPMGSGMTEHVRAVVEGDNGTFVATDENLLYFTSSGQRDFGWRKQFPHRTLSALHNDPRSKTLWISTNQGVVRLQSGKLSEFPTPDIGVLNRIRSVTTDLEGRLWLCDVDRGVYRSTDSGLTRFVLVANDKPASTVLGTRDGRVWVGFIDGTVRSYLNGQSESFSEEHGLPGGGTASALHEDRNGTLWVGTHRGLSRFSNGRFVTITRAEGFPGPGPVSIVDDRDGQLWLGLTGVGIVQLSPAEFEVAAGNRNHQLRYRMYGPADGLRGTPVRVFGTPTATRTSSGAMWFLTGNGLGIVDPARSGAPRAHAAPLLVEGIVANNREYAPAAGLTLPPNTTTLQIDYTLLSLAPLSQVNFRYKLDGFDANWIDAGQRRQAFYTNVGPGTYRFVVEAGTDDSTQRSLAHWQFTIQPRFYQTVWFGLACVFAGGLSLWGLWQLRLHQMRQRFSVVLQERARMGREIHDTLLQGLVGVAVQFKVIGDQLHASPDAARERLERLRKLVEHYITETRQSIWDLRSPLLETSDLATALRKEGQTLTADKNVRFELVVRGKPYPCPPKVEEQLLRVGREAVSNAVRHAHPSSVRAELTYQRGSVRLKIVDDGKGFDPSAPGMTSGAHWGLTSMRERAQEINGRFQLNSAPGRGTELELVVPALQAR
jgi:signal transduction histidine kinase/ligand-binding sensor domain-containing protein